MNDYVCTSAALLPQSPFQHFQWFEDMMSFIRSHQNRTTGYTSTPFIRVFVLLFDIVGVTCSSIRFRIASKMGLLLRRSTVSWQCNERGYDRSCPSSKPPTLQDLCFAYIALCIAYDLPTLDFIHPPAGIVLQRAPPSRLFRLLWTPIMGFALCLCYHELVGRFEYFMGRHRL